MTQNLMQKLIERILEQVYNKTNARHDAHYEEGRGLLIVPEGYPLQPRFVVLSVNYMQLHFMAMSNGDININ